MKPFLFSFADMQVPSFFFMIMIGTLACTFYSYWIAGKQGMRQEIILDAGMIGLICGVLGARLFHVFVEAPDYYWEHPTRVWEFWRGGFVSHGAFIGGTLGVLAYFRMRRLPVLDYADVIILGIPLLQFSIRLGCLLAGCCYGHPTDLPWGIRFTDPASTAYHYYPNIPLHPTQVYSMLHALSLFVFVNWFYRNKRSFSGQTFCIYFIGYFWIRGIIEFWRADADRGLWFHNMLSTGQIMALTAGSFAIVLYLLLQRRAKARGLVTAS